ncbi:MAG: hypothetical protein J0I33_09310 [Microbacterium ginsengisoli]|jgi:hypothetical protein|uniref:hypothetical protein n=1 Tax=Microbacterium TaxID=33882 RepID=UPI0006FD862F|nr:MULTISPECIES: hypothetical protein [unclassified Microbacterium]KQS02595.1 hypothetical protein ASF93_10015 [Microbacterium sp. Leaf347]KQS06013.1 hypothetical protein ASG00_00375 [Microbacterium sp. Leaf351]MBN9198824.1 hypothetical protein [Microbacterium ginsengisoli]OJU75599.1 MAG: hypothetical protein BGO15_01295 [Microbacterium sp. 71-23]
MNDPVAYGLAVGQATLATLALVLMTGLGYVRRPHPATLQWMLVFVAGAAGVYLGMYAESAGEESLRRLSLGISLGAGIFIWSGLRSWRGVRSGWAVPVLYVVLAASVLAVVPDEWFGLAFAAAYAVSGVFALLSIIELRRIPERADGMLLPLALISGAVTVVAAGNLVHSIIARPRGPEDLGILRVLDSVGAMIYIVCALVTLLWLAVGRGAAASGVPTGLAAFIAGGGDKLARAADRGERAWSVLSIRLDDVDDLRIAAGGSLFWRIVDTVERDVRASIPSEADIAVSSPGHLYVLLMRPPIAIESALDDLRAQVSRLDTSRPLAVQLSVSVGWSSVDASGYDMEALLRDARAGAARASADGGDRWVRVTEPVA